METIERGAEIPEGVTEVVDRDGDVWVYNDYTDTWATREACLDRSGRRLSSHFGPLLFENPTITLEVTMEQARAMRDVFGAVSGCPDTSRRGRIDEVDATLEALGVRCDPEVNGHVHFED